MGEFKVILGVAEGVISFVMLTIGAYALWFDDYVKATCFFVVALIFQGWSERNIREARHDQ